MKMASEALGDIIREMADKVRHPRKQGKNREERAAIRVIDEGILGPWDWLLRQLPACWPDFKLRRDIRGAIMCAYKEGYRRGRKAGRRR